MSALAPSGPARRPVFRPSALAAALACAGLAAGAQEAPPAESRSLEEVTVSGSREPTTEGTRSFTSTAPTSTATRLGLTARETPQSISTVTRERIEQQNLQTLQDVAQASTGVYVSTLDTERVTYVVRGYNVTNFQWDGMLNTFSSGGNIRPSPDTVVYDRIEILRGATGLSTGAGDPSATINLVRKRPTATFQGSAAVRIGTDSLRRGEIDLSGPLAFDGKLRGRLVLAKQKSESFRDFYRTDNTVAYGILEADLGPNTTVSFGHEYQDPVPRGVTWGTVLYWDAYGQRANLPRSLNLTAPWASWAQKSSNTFATFEHRFNDDWRVRAAYTRFDRDEDGKLYFGFGGYPRLDGSGITVAYGRFPYEERMDVADVNVDGKYRLFGRQHQVVFGWGRAVTEGYSARVLSPAMPPSYSQIPDWRTWAGLVPEFPTTVMPYAQSTTRTTQTAGYLATRLSLADPLHAVVGVRYGKHDRTNSAFAENGAPSTRTRQLDDDILTPYAGLLYDINDNLTVYGSYTDIFQPQSQRDRHNEFLEPSVGKSYELGLKGEFLDRRLTASAAVFKSVKDNLAEVDDSVPPNSLPGGGTAYRSTGKGNKVDGVELEIAGQVTPQWNVFAGYSHTRARNAQGEPINTFVPRNLLRVFTSYRFDDGALRGLTLGAGVNWQSRLWANAQRPTGLFNPSGLPITVTDRIVQPGFALVSLMASYQINPQLTATLNVENLFDKGYYNRVGFYNGVHWGEPRKVSLGLRAAF